MLFMSFSDRLCDKCLCLYSLNVFMILHVPFYLNCPYFVMPCHFCFDMLMILFVADPHVKQPLVDEFSWLDLC